MNHYVNKLESLLPEAMIKDRESVRRQLHRITKSGHLRLSGEKEKIRLLRLEKKVQASIRKQKWRKENLPKPTYNSALPIFAHKDEIIDAILKNRCLIISGETGSGKTTQIPQFCLAAGRGIQGKIGCTQPRRIAATTVAHRIAEELGEALGRSVGYKIRFKEKSGPNAFIKIMTDGILLAETQADPYLNQYDTLIVDEAHERSLNIDLTLGILKTLLKKRSDLKLIITSATIDTEKFSAAFDHAPIIGVSGRMYPVEIRYAAADHPPENSGDLTHIEKAIRTVEKLVKKSRSGDVLIFMPTEQDIRDTCELIEGSGLRHVSVFPLYARLSGSAQKSVFSRPPGRKIIVATNVAETSLTIPGIRYVIDTGLARISQYVPSSRTTSLPVLPISRSSADQRKGRCGRVENGLCIRLFSQADYETRPLFTHPEILRSNLAEVILKMIALRLDNLNDFPFIDQPAAKSIRDGYELLIELGAIEKRRHAGRFSLTEKGKVMAKMPLDPRLSRMVIEAEREGCLKEMAVIVSALSIPDVRERPAEKADEAEASWRLFIDPSSDFITLLNIWNRYHRTWQQVKSQNKMKRFCKDHYLSYKRMREWRDIHTQILAILDDDEMRDSRLAKESLPPLEDRNSKPLFERIHKSILSGFLSNIAIKKEKNIFTAAKGKEVMIFPGSGLFNRAGSWIVSAEMIKTSRLFARTVANIESGWMESIGKKQCKSTYLQPHWDKNRGEVVAFEQVSLYGLIIVPKRKVSYGRIHPDEAFDIFVRSALVGQDVKTPLSFMKHNARLVDQIKEMESRLRRRDLFVGEDEMAGFYKRRLPPISDINTLQRLIKEKGSDRFLRMKKKDLLLYAPDEKEIALYPDRISFKEVRLPLTYRFYPGEENDGVTVKIPLSLAAAVPSGIIDWVVPGLLKEKIALMIRGLPKPYRKKLTPVSRTVDTIFNEMPREKIPLITALGKFIEARFHLSIPASAWPTVSLPDHLRMRLSITGSKGEELYSGRDINLLYQEGPVKKELKKSAEFESAASAIERTGITCFDFERLPEAMTLKGKNGTEWIVYPGLAVDQNNTGPSPYVNLRLFDHQKEAVASHKAGVSALFCITLSSEVKFLKKRLALSKKYADQAKYFGGTKSLQKQMVQKIVDDLFCKNIRRKTEFILNAQSVSPFVLEKGRQLLETVLPILQAYHQARSTLERLERVNRSNRYAIDFLRSLREDLLRLVPKNFIRLYDLDRITHVARYIRAIIIRAERGLSNLEKDQNRAKKIKGYAERLDHFLKELSPSASDEKRKAIEALFWLIQEFGVSVFAQELKTPFPVSANRLEEKIREIERMA